MYVGASVEPMRLNLTLSISPVSAWRIVGCHQLLLNGWDVIIWCLTYLKRERDHSYHRKLYVQKSKKLENALA